MTKTIFTGGITVLLLAAPVGAADEPQAAEQKVTEYLKKIDGAERARVTIVKDSVARAFPKHTFVAVLYPQFPVGRAAPKQLSVANVLAVANPKKLNSGEFQLQIGSFLGTSTQAAKKFWTAALFRRFCFSFARVIARKKQKRRKNAAVQICRFAAQPRWGLCSAIRIHSVFVRITFTIRKRYSFVLRSRFVKPCRRLRNESGSVVEVAKVQAGGFLSSKLDFAPRKSLRHLKLQSISNLDRVPFSKCVFIGERNSVPLKLQTNLLGEFTMTAAEIVAELKPLGTESYRKVLINHGIPEPLYGVKIEDMKKIFVKRIKKDYQLALDLYDTGVFDAMYLAGLIADDEKMTRKDLQHWVDHSTCRMLSEYTVPWVASGSKHGRELALKWIDSKKESVASTGWSTLSSLVGITDDSELDLDELKRMLERVQTTIHKQPDRVRYVMNGFVISVGSYVKSLTDLAMRTAKEIGAVSVNMDGTACKVPFAPDYIEKVKQRGSIGKKRKSAKC